MQDGEPEVGTIQQSNRDDPRKESGRATMGRGWNTSFLEAETGDYGEFKGQPGLNIKTVPLVMMILMMMKAKSAPPSTRHATPRDVKPDGQ